MQSVPRGRGRGGDWNAVWWEMRSERFCPGGVSIALAGRHQITQKKSRRKLSRVTRQQWAAAAYQGDEHDLQGQLKTSVSHILLSKVLIVIKVNMVSSFFCFLLLSSLWGLYLIFFFFFSHHIHGHLHQEQRGNETKEVLHCKECYTIESQSKSSWMSSAGRGRRMWKLGCMMWAWLITPWCPGDRGKTMFSALFYGVYMSMSLAEMDFQACNKICSWNKSDKYSTYWKKIKNSEYLNFFTEYILALIALHWLQL